MPPLGCCRQYSCCCLIPSVSWGAQLIAWFHLVVCAFALLFFSAGLRAVAVVVIVAEIIMHLTLLYGVIRRRRVAVALWVAFSLAAAVYTAFVIAAATRDGVEALGRVQEGQRRQVATGKVVLAAVLATAGWVLELYYVLVVWSFYLELKEEDALFLPQTAATTSQQPQEGLQEDVQGKKEEEEERQSISVDSNKL